MIVCSSHCVDPCRFFLLIDIALTLAIKLYSKKKKHLQLVSGPAAERHPWVGVSFQDRDHGQETKGQYSLTSAGVAIEWRAGLPGDTDPPRVQTRQRAPTPKLVFRYPSLNSTLQEHEIQMADSGSHRVPSSSPLRLGCWYGERRVGERFRNARQFWCVPVK